MLTWSARGFGRSSGQIALNSPDYEVKDVRQLVDWLARQPRVRLDAPGTRGWASPGLVRRRPRADGRGLRPQDRRDRPADHLVRPGRRAVPERHRAGARPADSGVFKKQWAGLLFTQGSRRARTAGGPARPGGGNGGGQEPAGASAPAEQLRCGRFLPEICDMYQQVATAGRATAQAISLLSGPARPGARPDRGADAADPGTARLAVPAGPGGRQLPGHPPQRCPGGHGAWFAGGHDGGNRRPTGSPSSLHWFDLLTPWHRLRPARHRDAARPARSSASTGRPRSRSPATLGRDPSTAARGARRTPPRRATPACPAPARPPYGSRARADRSSTRPAARRLHLGAPGAGPSAVARAATCPRRCRARAPPSTPPR